MIIYTAGVNSDRPAGACRSSRRNFPPI